jgi:membrane dipeptidase
MTLRRSFHILPLSSILLLLSSCHSTQKVAISDPYRTQALQILKTTPIIDTHIDFPYSLVEHDEAWKPGTTALALKHPKGDFDYERAVKGGLYGPFMSIYIPARYQNQKGRSKEVADSLINIVYAVAHDHPKKFALAPRAEDVERRFKKGIIALPMGMENGSPIETLDDVGYFHQRGIRYVTLAHSRDNQISDSSYDTLHTHGGLSDFGRQVVREMNRVGIMVDVSHLTDDAIRDVLETSTRPVIATHSACRHFTPGYQRNIPDELIQALAAENGVVCVPFSHYFLSTQSRDLYLRAVADLKSQGIDQKSDEGHALLRAAMAKAGITAKDVADHIDHIKNIAGIDHIGLGSDFDGVDLALPPDLADVSMYPNLLAELLRRGYSESDLKKICYQNVLRVWKANE